MMMTAMARLPCNKQNSPPPQHSMANNFGNNNPGGYWDAHARHLASPYLRTHHRHSDYMGKRKSAVELLQESKAFYVKSEIVLDRKQELKNSGHLQVSQLTAPGAPPRLLRKSGNTAVTCFIPGQSTNSSCSQLSVSNVVTTPSPPCCWVGCHEQDRGDGISNPQATLPPPAAPTLPPKSPRLVPVPQRRTISIGPITTGSDQLQTKLRRLLNTDSKENVFFPDSPPQTVGGSPITNSNGQNLGDSHSPNAAMRDEKLKYSPGSLSPGYREHFGPQDIIRFKFGRSNSHSHTTSKQSSQKCNGGSASVENTAVCHKSLPDLHTSTRRRASLSPRASAKVCSTKSPPIHHLSTNNCPDCETSSDYSEHSFKRDAFCYRSSRSIRRSLGSGGCDTSSVLSSGGRTQKSSGSSKLSHGATARDSGGSSGHCTHRSEPPPKIQDYWSHVRRDSGASTQHSTERNRSRKGSYAGGVPPSIVRQYSPDSESSNSQTDYSPTCNSRFSDGWKEGRGRPILRSKSDISDRYWRQDNGRSNKIVGSNSARSVADLEEFFDRLGLDLDNYRNITEPDSKCSSPVFFDSVSSVDSALGLYSWTGNNQTNQNPQWQNNCSTGMGNDECSHRVNDPPSIVERNARIIKWLCQCRKVQFGYS